jgi:hypothetical protein
MLHFRSMNRRILRWCVISLFLCGTASARERCSAEAKLLVSPAQTENAVAVLHAGKSSQENVYLFDTQDSDLLSQGVIVRIRTGAKNDLTVKVRFNERVDSKGPLLAGNEALKCERDIAGNEELTSYSLDRDWYSKSVPETGEEVYSALSAEQQKLLGSAGISIDWHRVKRRAEIHAIDWRAHPGEPLQAITIELWKWSGGTILELSARTVEGGGAGTLHELRELAQGSGLAIEANQTVKTSLVLNVPE